jgi:iron complex outermembrane receptor protein
VVTITLWSAAFSAPSIAQDRSKGLEEIVVTAQRREEKLLDVPMSIAVVSGEAIEKSGAQNIQNLAQLTSGVMVSYNGIMTQPSFRGVTNIVGANASENNVATYVDGLYQPDAIFLSSDFANIGNIQFLKGPQGALYGRNATGGAILITTLAPSRTLTGKFEIGYASFNEKKFSGYISGPINDRIRFSLTGYSRVDDGFIKLSDRQTGLPTNNNAAPAKSQTVRLKIEADVTDNLTATAGLNFDDFNDPRFYSQQSFAYISPAVPTPPLRPLNPNPDLVAYDVLSKALTVRKEATLKLDLKTSIGVLTSNSDYIHSYHKSRYDLDGTYADNIHVESNLLTEVYQTNLSYAIDAIKNLSLIVGGDYYHYRISAPDTRTYGSNRSILQESSNTIGRQAYSLFIDGTYNITDKLSLAAGGRYAHETSDVFYASHSGSGAVINAPDSKTASWSKFTPRASLRYAITSESNAYFSFSQGFKSGQWPLGLDPPAPANQETITAYELGFKLSKSDFQFNTAVFYYDYKDIQISIVQLDPACASTPAICRTLTLLFNGPKSRIYGADGDFTWSPVERLRIRATASYLHARYLAFPNASGTGLNIATGFNVGNQTQDWSNTQMARAPTFSGTLGIEYDLNTSFGDFLFGTNASFTTSYVPTNPSVYGPLAGPDLAGKQRYRQWGYALLNAQITWTDLTGRLSLTVFGRNLTDKNYFVNYRGTASGDNGQWAPPRVVGAKAQYQF